MISYESLLTEIIALLFVAVLLLSLSAYRRTATQYLKLFRGCLVLSMTTIAWDILCFILLEYPAQVPRSINMLMNSIYFMMVVALCSLTAMFMFKKVLEHVYDQFCLRRARIILTLLTAAFLALVIINIRTGYLFWFDEKGIYHRGILNGAGYVILGIEAVLIFICFIRHHASVSREMKYVLLLVSPVAAALMLFQLMNPELLLNGTIAAFADVILFITFFCQRREIDNITGIGNREGFFSELSLRVAGNQQFQVILIFPRSFGNINQRYGYHIGNEFLYSIAMWLERTYTHSAVFRYVGVSFAVILPYDGADQAKSHIQELEQRFARPWKVAWREESITVGLSDLLQTGSDIKEDQMMEILDHMLSRIKRSTVRYIPYDTQAARAFLRRRQVAERVREAIAGKLFEVWYQPVYFPAQSGFYSAEALVRLKDNDGQFISPSEFIAIAEEMGNVDDIFWQVLNEVCRFLKEAVELPVNTISVNMSIEQFEDQRLPEKIRDTLKTWEVPPGRICLEITERVIAEDNERTGGIVRQLENDGFLFYLDDFGIGYSNFATVSQLRFECIKLDKSLVSAAATDDKSYKMVRGMIRLFHEQEIKVIAEGTETLDETRMMLELGADRIQGYYYAKPMPGAKLLEFLKDQTPGLW